MNLLQQILDLVFPPRSTELLVRMAALDALRAYYGALPLPYRDPLVHAAIVEAKFHRNQKAQRMLGIVLEDELLALAEEHTLAPLILIPLPLSKERRRSRGYNQVEEIAKHAVHDLSAITLAPNILKRVRNTPAQTGLSGRERRENMKGAFLAEDVDSASTYIVVDDVITTGATLNDAVRALKAAGARDVIPLALAH